ncbi:MAG: adenylosuccinate synthase [Bacteroides sp.]|nr:adenylosuccinate synthase [Bacteroidales bacterium]MBD5303072.1 adenylosuccinate synthase [Bacteroides sp.]MBD5305062.1 adenylosuccinate synthase [Bacteroides sp.]MBD5348607.1 adenylosuccinate synthase [Bacteroides sp.]
MSETLVVVGSQWGDEGKGKITDYFATRADMVVRYQGGNNAGHTVVFDGNKYSLQSIPSGIFNPKTVNIMGNGMVVNPVSVVAELEKLHDRGITDYQLYISTRAAMVMPWHPMLDGAYESQKGDALIGTTKKGIGPAYSDKYSRTGMRMGDLLEPEYFRERLEAALEVKNMELKMLGLEPLEVESVYNEYMALAEKLGPMITDTSRMVNDALRTADKRILFEGAQGMMLCIDHGTYPFVTSSSPSAASVPVGAGISPKWINEVVGVAKAYCTRVGSGPFPTELFDEIGDGIRERGHEYGTVTGRPRRIGWFDAVVGRYTAELAGISHWAVMLLDVLSGLDTIKICVAYELDGKEIQSPPSTIASLARCKPVYIEMPGWKEDITNIKNFEDLPENAKAYIHKLEEVTGTPVGMISVGPDREQTIIVDPELNKF